MTLKFPDAGMDLFFLPSDKRRVFPFLSLQAKFLQELSKWRETHPHQQTGENSSSENKMGNFFGSFKFRHPGPTH